MLRTTPDSDNVPVSKASLTEGGCVVLATVVTLHPWTPAWRTELVTLAAGVVSRAQLSSIYLLTPLL